MNVGKLVRIMFGIALMSSNMALAENEALDCVIEPSKLIEVSSQVRGVLETIYVDRGDFVKKGQLIAKLMSGVEKASVQLARDRAKMDVDIQSRKAEWKFKDSVLAQVAELHHKKLASRRDYDDAKTASIVAKIELKKAQKLKYLAVLELRRTEEVLKLRSIHSMVDGVVVEVMKSKGEFIEEQPIMKIAQIDPLNIEVIVPEQLIGSVEIGKQSKVIVDIPVKNSYLGTVSIIDQVIDAASGTFGVRLTLANPGNKIYAGQRCKVVLTDEDLDLEGGNQ